MYEGGYRRTHFDFFFGAGSRAATIAWAVSIGYVKPGRAKYLIKNILQLVLSQGRALDVFDSTQILGHTVTVLLANGLHFLSGKLLPHTRVIAQIGLGTDDQAGNTGAVVVDFREPLLANVFKGRRGGDGKADQEDIGLGVGERTETVVILLTGGIEEAQGVGFVTDPRENSISRYSATEPWRTYMTVTA